MPGKIRKALALYRSVAEPENVEIRLHRTVLYNSIYRVDDQLIVNHYAYGSPAAHVPVFFLRGARGGEMSAMYRDSLELARARAIARPAWPKCVIGPLPRHGKLAVSL
jgi:hypothetical protein